jgi:hypothetical protein
MGFFDSISETVSNIMGGASDQVGNVVEDVTSQIPGADQFQEVTDQVTQVKDSVLPGDESGGEQ